MTTINEFMLARNIQITAFDKDDDSGICIPSWLLCLKCGAEYEVGNGGGSWQCPNGCHKEEE